MADFRSDIAEVRQATQEFGFVLQELLAQVKDGLNFSGKLNRMKEQLGELDALRGNEDQDHSIGMSNS